MDDFSQPSRAGHWCHFTEDGIDIQLWINEPPDTIQAAIQQTGTFYEVGALRLLRALLPPSPRIVDIGANFGNHSVYFARIGDAAWLLPIEPNPEVIPELRKNLAANGCSADLSYLGVAVGARPGRLHLCLDPADAVIHNRGGTRLVDSHEQATGPTVPVIPLDDLVSGDIDLVKIDVEGMAVAVLEGASALIERCAPLILVEVNVCEMPAFFDWLCTSSYRVAGASSDYIGLTNVVLQHSQSRSPFTAGDAAGPEARIAQALTNAEAATAHAERADATLRSTLARSGALERCHAQARAQSVVQVRDLTETIHELSTEVARLRAIETNTTWKPSEFIRWVSDGAPKWLRGMLRQHLPRVRNDIRMRD